MVCLPGTKWIVALEAYKYNKCIIIYKYKIIIFISHAAMI